MGDERWLEHPLRFRGKKISVPTATSLNTKGQPFARGGEYKAMLQPQEEDVPELVEWINETMMGRAVVRAIWRVEVMDYCVIRDFKGVVVYFNNAIDSVHFQLMWTDSHTPVFGDFELPT